MTTTNSPEAHSGYQRRHCGKCGEDLSFTESDPCDKCTDVAEAQPQGGELLPCPFCGGPAYISAIPSATPSSPRTGILAMDQQVNQNLKRAKMPETIDLHQCPFCGSRDVTLSNGYDEDGNWVVICGRCKSSGTFCAEKAKAIERWNTRADLPRATADALVVAREIIGNVNNYAEDNGELSISAFGPLAKRIAAAIAAPRATGETTVEGVEVDAERKQIRGVLDSLRRGPKTTGCWCTGGWRKPPQHSTACKAAHRLYKHLSDCMAQVRAATCTEGEGSHEPL